METLAFETTLSKFEDHPAWVPRVPRKRALTELIVVLLAMWAVFLLVGCTKKTETSYNDSTSAAHNDTNAMTTNAPAAPPATTSTAPAPQSMSDANVLAELSEADSAEISAAKLVLQKSKNSAVKSFASMMIADHTKMKKEKAELAKKMNVTPAPPANDPVPNDMTQEMGALNSASTPQQLDSIYVSQAVDDHTKDLSEVESLQSTVQSPDLKDALKKAAPVIKKHLDHAKMLQDKMKK
jgi:putative membrane protein